MKVSVIVPVYNVEEYLTKCLDSLVHQTLEDIEIILINDGSTDRSQAILDRYKKKYPEKIRVFYKENGGQGSARNIGIREASGDYIGFVDSDDYVTLDMFEKLYAAAIREDADLVTCNYYYIDDRGQRKINLYKPQKQTDLFFNPWAAPWNKLYRRTILTKNNVFYPELRAYEDTAFYADIIPFVNKIINIDDPLIYQFYHGSSTMNAKQNERTLLIFDVIDYILNFYRDHGVYEKYYEYLEYFCSKILLSSSVLRLCQIRDRKIRRKYLNLTIDEVNRRFPGYKRNRYFKTGLKGLYIRTISKITIPVYADLIYVVRYMGRNRL